MGQKEKLLQKLQENPRSFTFDDAERLLGYCGMYRSNKGRTSGSRVIFTGGGHGDFLMHRPHPQKELKPYQAKELQEFLKREGLLSEKYD